MCIECSVGRGGKNNRDDVRTVQLLLNLNHPQVAGPIVADGVCGGATAALIEAFQHGVIGDADPQGLIPPDGSTIEALRSGMPPGLLEEKLESIYIHAASARVSQFFTAMLASMAAAAINTPLRQSHFLAQVGHESGELRYTEELASGTAYEGRKDLGNTQPGDGARFKGRGLIQLTGRTNYAAFGKAVGLNLIANPKQVATESRLSVDAATWFWTTHHLNALADKDDTLALTKRINGGTNGLADREAKLKRAKWFLLPAHPDPAENGLVRAMQAVSGTDG
ncbi:putative chitinase [Terriglobus roseus DSM 18391]|uniref:Putative chitinase n=1 Tax=Terriglobus roseus (strain DSM 18391 / NRRL B-41598 / KBS 63) TaxID=926566 RepID=I3ZMG2_TERRK|nr:glycoside hydrolase family 19 protein [Terriglobus roseus]AFL90430.1 putative chitinase [Terriglobus roseus DSM 18391]